MPLAESATRDERQPLESFLDHFFLLFFLEWPSRAGCVRLLAFYNLSFSGHGPLGMSVRIRMIMDHESNDACTGRMKRVWEHMHPFVRGPHLSEIFSCRYCFDRIGQGI